MNMQHDGLIGQPIAKRSGERFADRMRRISEARLDEGALATINCRISAGKVPWFAIRVRTGREQAVENALGAMDIATLVPMRRGPDLRRRGRIIVGSMMPVIHGYVLAQMLPISDYLSGFLGIEHVIDILGGCDRQVRLSDKEVWRFNGLAEAGVYDWERPVDITLVQGEPVFIVAGPFAGQKAIVVTPNRKGRGDVVVAIAFMGGDVPASVPLALIRKM
ncbi:transcription termination/antitermination NusG family protein [Shinella zoogloeoides]|uniref:transcription termination/antitermination NusG family protein n=1 Tax=Shinella zoogloeoides TaxID=352475 RepID=UPI00273D5703|nr:transcription termination/antitermination NusG family protein [Shinella zoogloeoides]WLR92928.1 transcription termination/antitermination NusG family protein [Shinella zoogloeoides]